MANSLSKFTEPKEIVQSTGNSPEHYRSCSVSQPCSPFCLARRQGDLKSKLLRRRQDEARAMGNGPTVPEKKCKIISPGEELSKSCPFTIPAGVKLVVPDSKDERQKCDKCDGTGKDSCSECIDAVLKPVSLRGLISTELVIAGDCICSVNDTILAQQPSYINCALCRRPMPSGSHDELNRCNECDCRMHEQCLEKHRETQLCQAIKFANTFGDSDNAKCVLILVYLVFYRSYAEPRVHDGLKYLETHMDAYRLQDDNRWQAIELYSHYLSEKLKLEQTKVLERLRLLNINAYVWQNGWFQSEGLAFDFIVSMLNHSCEPNAYLYISEGVTTIAASRTIAPGEYVTINYAQCELSDAMRHQELKDRFFFECKTGHRSIMDRVEKLHCVECGAYRCGCDRELEREDQRHLILRSMQHETFYCTEMFGNTKTHLIRFIREDLSLACEPGLSLLSLYKKQLSSEMRYEKFLTQFVIVSQVHAPRHFMCADTVSPAFLIACYDLAFQSVEMLVDGKLELDVSKRLLLLEVAILLVRYIVVMVVEIPNDGLDRDFYLAVVALFGQLCTCLKVNEVTHSYKFDRMVAVCSILHAQFVNMLVPGAYKHWSMCLVTILRDAEAMISVPPNKVAVNGVRSLLTCGDKLIGGSVCGMLLFRDELAGRHWTREEWALT